jgi:uncharacterized protein YoxC
VNSVAQSRNDQAYRGPIKGTLSDADVKQLIVRAAKAKSAFEVHGIIRIFCQNRIALTKVIEQLTGELTKSRSAVSSQFDLALLDQLKVVRQELDEASRARDAAQGDAIESSEKLHRMEQMHDKAQRLAEGVQRELLLANMDREQLRSKNLEITDDLNRKSNALQSISNEVAELRNRLIRTEISLNETIDQGRAVTTERDALRQQLAGATGDVALLKKRLAGNDRLLADLRLAVKKHVDRAAADREMIRDFATELETLRYQQRKTAQSTTVSAPSLANVVGTNVVAFTNNAELEKLRQQVKLRDTTIAGKDNMISQLSSANTAMKGRLSEVEERMNQVDAAFRGQSLANQTLAIQLLEMLPEQQRSIYSRPSHDASSVLLITSAVKRHLEEQTVAAQFGSATGHSL